MCNQMVTSEIREHFYPRFVQIIRISQVKFTILLHILISSQLLDAKKHRLVNEKLPAEENHGGTPLRIFLQMFFFGAFRFSKACFNALIFIHNIVNAILKRCRSKIAPNF